MIHNSPSAVGVAYGVGGNMPNMFPGEGMMPGGGNYGHPEFPILAHEGMGDLNQFSQGGLEAFMLPQQYDPSVW